MTDETDQPASKIIDAFGGIRPMAARLDIPVSTVQGWKQRDSIPAGRMEAIRAAAEAADIDLTGDEGSADPGVMVSSAASGEKSAGAASDDRRSSPADSLQKTDEAVTFAPEERPSTPARGAGVAILALVVALGVGGWVWWSTQGPGASSGDNARISALEGRVARLAETSQSGAPAAEPAALAALTRDVAALRSELGALSPPDMEAALAPLRAEIDGLREALAAQGPGGDATPDASLLERLEAIDAEIQNATQLAATNMQAMSGGLLDFETRLKALAEAQTESVAGLSARIDAVEAGRSADEADLTRASTLALAAGQLRTALERGAPYAGPLELVATVSADNPELDAAVTALRGMSETGVATAPALELSFARLVPEVLAADRTGAAGADRDLVDRLTGRINDIISVRRTGTDVSGDGVEARIARAEVFLADGEVAAALGAFDGFEGPGADILAPWLAQARGHVEARDALALVEARAIARLGAEGGAR